MSTTNNHIQVQNEKIITPAHCNTIWHMQYKCPKVYSTDYESKADIKVYMVKYEGQAGDNDGKWFFTQYSSMAKKKIFFVDYESRADLKVYFVEYEGQAGGRNNAKKSLLY